MPQNSLRIARTRKSARTHLAGVLTVLISALLLTALALPAESQTYSVVYSFASESDGFDPNGPLIQDSAGNLYGTTYVGGAFGQGTVFKLDPAGVKTILYNFTDGADGGGPLAGLFRDPNGTLYGTTAANASYPKACGTVFGLDTKNNLTVLHTFTCLTGDAIEPSSRLVSVNGELYGTTPAGGTGPCSFGCGTIYKITKTGKETVLYSFKDGVDGMEPQGLIRDEVGNLYGASYQGGSFGFGNIFRLDTQGTFTVLHSFDYPTEGAAPFGRLIRDKNGNIHGTAEGGGDPGCNCGVVYRLDKEGKETILHKFYGRNSGSQPYGGLLDVAGILYGTTTDGGDVACSQGDHCGVLFEIDRTGHYSVLHHFTGGDDGLFPLGELMLGVDGSIYGVTRGGGMDGGGTIFKYTP
jgi:uncharacterized repeat protein (TIGR03803 family)